jgi:membrane fusion protein, adhesin transport system
MSDRHLEDLTDRIKPRAASNLLLWGILAFFVVFLIWAALTKLDRTVLGMGRVVPSSQLQIVSNLEGGIVESISIKTGMVVKAGDELIRLSPLQTDAELGSSNATTGALTVKIARLEAEVGGRTPNYPFAADPALRDIITIESTLHSSRMADLSSGMNAASARINQAQRAVAEAQANYAARSSARDSSRSELDMIRPLVERGIEPRMALVQAENAAAVAAGEAAAASASIARAQAGVGEARASMSQLQQDWRSRAGTELAAAQAELSARQRTMPALADRVARTTIRAPLSGRVNRVLVNTVGGTIRPGEPVVEIVPSELTLLIEAQVSPKDIAFVRIGQKSKVDVTAYESAIYGSLHGKVVSISPDAVLNERTGETHYLVKVRTNTNALVDKSGTKLPIGPGMIATVNLLGDKRSVLDYLLTPITRLSERALRE